jgi:hypothetical protein
MATEGWDDELTLEFARELVARADPEELPLLDAMAPTFLAEGAEVHERADGTLGFGVEIFALASVAIPVAKFVGTFLVGVLTSVAADSVKDAVRNQIKRKPEAQPVPADVVGRARTMAFEHSKSLGLDDERAALLADAVGGALTTPART